MRKRPELRETVMPGTQLRPLSALMFWPIVDALRAMGVPPLLLRHGSDHGDLAEGGH